MTLKKGSWIQVLVDVYNSFGGTASYAEVYQRAEIERKSRGLSWTTEAKATIRRTVEDHARSSANFRGTEVFYSVSGHGNGVWALMPAYLVLVDPRPAFEGDPAYAEGLEGIFQEAQYLRRSRDPKLVEERKKLDRHACQACLVTNEVISGRFVIDVHHLNPLGMQSEVVVTGIDDLICLCPTCHRIAHSRAGAPLSVIEVKQFLADKSASTS